MSSDERLTETLRVRVSPSERAALEKIARADRRSVSAIARRGIQRELEQPRKRAGGES